MIQKVLRCTLGIFSGNNYFDINDDSTYRKARNEMQELVRAQKNVERFFAEEKDTSEKTQTR